jgi:hypothetical protein
MKKKKFEVLLQTGERFAVDAHGVNEKDFPIDLQFFNNYSQLIPYFNKFPKFFRKGENVS